MNKVLKMILMLFGGNNTKVKLARKEGVKLGEGCTILGMPHWGSEPFLIQIGDYVRITSGVRFVNHDGGMHVIRRSWSSEYDPVPDADLFGKIKIGNNVFIGTNSIIMPNVIIGDNVIIGAGSVVTKDIPSGCVAAGVPARVIRTLDEYYKKNRDRIEMTKNMDPADKRRFLEERYGGN